MDGQRWAEYLADLARDTQTDSYEKATEIRRRSNGRPKLMHRTKGGKFNVPKGHDQTAQKPRKCVEISLCVCAGMCGLVFDFVLAAKLLSARILIMASLKCRTRKMFANKEADNKRCPEKRKM